MSYLFLLSYIVFKRIWILAPFQLAHGVGPTCSNVVFLANVNSPSRSLYAIARPSVCRLSSVTLVRPTQAVQIFGNISMAFGTLAIH